MRRVAVVSALVAFSFAGLALLPAEAGGIRPKGPGETWTVVPATTLQSLPWGLGLPYDLKVGVLGANPTTVNRLTGALTPTTVRAAYTLVNGSVVPTGLAVYSNPAAPAFDAQQPVWLLPPAPPLPAACVANPLLTFFECPTTLVSGLKIEWGSPAYEQLIFLNLGSHAGVQIYDSNDYNCNSQGLDNLGSTCQYDNAGQADDAWEFGFNCVASQPATGVPGGCPNGAALQWRGMLYTASADVLDLPSALDPEGGPALNEFVYNAGQLYIPPGWQSFFVTQSSLRGPSCGFTAGSSLTFTAKVSAGKSTSVPTGSIALLDGASTLSTGTVSSAGTATFTVTLGSGLHSLTAAYQGDALNAPSQSAADILVSWDQFRALAPKSCE